MNCLISVIIYLKAIKDVLIITLLSFWNEDELICALKNMPKNKSPGNDGLTKEFYEKFLGWFENTIHCLS